MSGSASPAPLKASPSKAGPSQPTGLKKLRKKKRANNLNRALDEFDDVDESDLVAGPAKRQRIGGGGDDGDVGASDEDEEDGDVDGDADVTGREVTKEVDPSRLEKISAKRKKQAYYLREMCDAEQGKRYDAFVVTSIPKAAVTKVKDDFASILGGLAKIFVAEVVELAKDIQEERGLKGPLTPELLRMAKARMEDTGLKSKKGMFRR